MFDGRAGRICAEIVAAFPVVLWPYGPGTKTAATIRADIVQNLFDTGTAERAFKRANHRVRGIRRQRHVTVLACGSYFKHGRVLFRRLSCVATSACLDRVGLAIRSFHLCDSDLIIGIPLPSSGFLGGLVVHVRLPCDYRLLA